MKDHAMFKSQGQQTFFILILFVLVQLSIQGKDTDCSDQQYKAFEECSRKELPFKCAKQIIISYPKCFFGEEDNSNSDDAATTKSTTKDIAPKQECTKQCNLQFKRCKDSARNRKVLVFPCKVGVNVCMTRCHKKPSGSEKPAHKKKTSHGCLNQCESDFRECFGDIKSFPQSTICTESRRYCKQHSTCYRLTTNTEAYRITFMRLRNKLKKLYS